ncbi:recombinase family protein [Streptococcus parasanguinis]|uniref:recombinase family protein n=1 Tax=Streptococcus TaxID=1301 RepID=UPI002A89BAB5|nr:recombinase family protein [Streptococcus suis]MDY7594474.1 recombinase family protein [Streptococcus suis]HEL2254366.1 recombinase family protein [Streptococcus suis]HEM5039895.1 recombinase family protein [Streptococcus suis]HEM5050399.1 recombinase family protein [Streptococcus suis]
MSKVALYLRLSVDEAGTDESNSIVNQRHLLHHFLDNSSDFQNFQREEFVDDGFSGISVNRPAFQRLMTRVKSGEIHHIIVKDLSRFMRDYLELGNYLENIFPFLGVRFIALNDQYDSLTSENNGVEIDVSFKNLLNEFYAKDVSEKVKSAMNTMKRSGKNMSWLPPFGYLKDPTDRFKIIIDAAVAPIVRQIFRLSIEGLGDKKIALLLNEEKTITPAERKMQVSQAKYQKSIILTDEQQRNIWTSNTVRQILKNEAYKGTYLFNTRTYIKGKHITRPQSEWERIENNHEALVTPEEFEQAHRARQSRRTHQSQQKSRSTEDVVLRGFVFCEHCQHRLSLIRNHNQGHYFYCRYCKSQGHSMRSCKVDKIEKVIFEVLKNKSQEPRKLLRVNLLHDIEKLKEKKLAAFQDYKENRITRDVYIAKKQELDDKIVHLEENLQTTKAADKLSGQTLSREVIETHVEKVIVDCLGFFEVIYK